MRLGAVHLVVADLARSTAYYENAIGLRVRERDDGTAWFGAGGADDLLVLHEEPGAKPVTGGHSGLFHFALLLPDRPALGRWLDHAARHRIPLSGASDHLVSEALYLRDPDGHGIEIYRDRPRGEWPMEDGGRVGMATLPLDLDDVRRANEADGDYPGMPHGTTMGHVHLHVADIPETESFYGDLGFDVMARYGSDATFMSVGGYHHHLGGNTWAGHGVKPPPPGSAALHHATMIVPGLAEEREVVDPAGNRWLVRGG